MARRTATSCVTALPVGYTSPVCSFVPPGATAGSEIPRESTDAQFSKSYPAGCWLANVADVYATSTWPERAAAKLASSSMNTTTTRSIFGASP